MPSLPSHKRRHEEHDEALREQLDSEEGFSCLIEHHHRSTMVHKKTTWLTVETRRSTSNVLYIKKAVY